MRGVPIYETESDSLVTFDVLIQTQVERLKAQNSKLASEKLGPVGGCKK